jgi:CBS domain-containing protein
MAQETASSGRSKAGTRMDELKRLRDEIRQDLRRATMELRDEWKELERKLPDPSAAAEQLRGATAEMAERLVEELRKFRSRLQRNAGDASTLDGLMSRPAVTCFQTDSLARAVTLMWERDVGFLPVLDDASRMVGTLTDRDSAIAACTRGQRLDEIPVESVMSRQVVTCSPGSPPAAVLALMKQHQLRRVPVLEEGRPIGIVTINDLARASADGSDRGAISPKDIVEAQAAIARPRHPDGNPDA